MASNYVAADELEQGNKQYEGPLNEFAPDHVRRGFVRKVYGIVCVQLALTAVIACTISQYLSIDTVQGIIVPASVVSLLGLFGVTCYIIAKPHSMREVPCNYAILLAFTICESLPVGLICCAYQAQSVLLAFGVTMGIFLGLTIFACTTDRDFTGCGGMLLCCLLGMIITGFVLCFFQSDMVQTLYAGYGAVLFSMYIVYDTQKIVGGRHKKHQFMIDDTHWLL